MRRTNARHGPAFRSRAMSSSGSRGGRNRRRTRDLRGFPEHVGPWRAAVVAFALAGMLATAVPAKVGDAGASGAAREQGDPADAGTWYARAMELLEPLADPGDLGDQQGLDPGPMRVLDQWGDFGGPPTPEVRGAFAALGEVLDALARGARCRGFDAEAFTAGDGPATGHTVRFPVAHELRSLADLAVGAAAWRRLEGDGPGATSYLETALGVLVHLLETDGMAPMLVATHAIDDVFDEARALHAAGLLGPGEAARLRRSMAAIPSRDPAGMAAAYDAFRGPHVERWRREYGTAEARRDGSYGIAHLDVHPAIERIRGLDDAAFDRALDGLARGFADLVRALSIEEPGRRREAVEALYHALAAGDEAYGPVARVDLERRVLYALQRTEEAEGLVRRFREFTGSIEAGRPWIDRSNGIRAIATAAARWSAIAPERRDHWRAWGRTDEGAAPPRDAFVPGLPPWRAARPETRTTLHDDDVAAVLDGFAFAGRADDCDVRILLESDHGTFVPACLASLREAGAFAVMAAERSSRPYLERIDALRGVVALARAIAILPHPIAPGVAGDLLFVVERTERRHEAELHLVARERGIAWPPASGDDAERADGGIGDDAGATFPEAAAFEALRAARRAAASRADRLSRALAMNTVDVADRINWWRCRAQHGGRCPRRNDVRRDTRERVREWPSERLVAAALALDWIDAAEATARAEATGLPVPHAGGRDYAAFGDLIDLDAVARVLADADRWREAFRAADLAALESLPAPVILRPAGR